MLGVRGRQEVSSQDKVGVVESAVGELEGRAVILGRKVSVGASSLPDSLGVDEP